MNTVEELFKNAQDTLDDEIFVPVVLSKLAERGYQPETEEEMVELLKHACVIRDALREGQVATVPMSALDEQGNLSKQASEALQADPYAFADNFDCDLEKMSADVQDAAAIGLCGFKMAIELEKDAAGKPGMIGRALATSKKYIGGKAREASKAVGKSYTGAKKTVGKKYQAAKKTVSKKYEGAKKEVGKQLSRPGVAAATAGGAGVAAGGAAGYAAGKSSKKDSEE